MPSTDGPCAGRLRVEGKTLTEPFVAIHPTEDDTVVIAAISTAPETVAPTATEGALLLPLRVTFFVTTDGGETWTQREHPDLPHPDGGATRRNTVDPALAFDAEGRLHVSLLALNGHVYHIATPDLGRTWVTSVELSEDRGADRNWITYGSDDEIFVPWYQSDGAVVAHTQNDGVDWHVAILPGCGIASDVVQISPHPLVACTTLEEDEPVGITVATLDTQENRLDEVARLDVPGANWPRLLVNGTGGLHLVSEARDQRSVWHTTSSDGGATWKPVDDLRDHLTIEDRWERVRPYWATLDPWGSLHLILSEDGPTVEGEGPFIYVKPTFGPAAAAVAHVVIDPGTDRVLTERLLSRPAESTDTDESPPSPVAPFDHYHGLAFGEDRGILAWAERGAISYTVVEPVRDVGDREPLVRVGS